MRCFSDHQPTWLNKLNLEVSGNGRYVAVGSREAVHVVDLDPQHDAVIRTPEEHLREAEILSGLQLLDNGSITRLSWEGFRVLLPDTAQNASTDR